MLLEVELLALVLLEAEVLALVLVDDTEALARGP